MNSNNIFQIIQKICICPYCNGDLKWSNSAICVECGDEYPIDINSKQVDLRLRRPKEIVLT